MHKVARVAAESNASFLVFSKLSKCIHNSIYAQLKAWANSFTTERQQGSVRRSLLLWYCLGFGEFPINNCVLYSPGWTNLRTTIKTEILPLNVDNDQLVTFLFPVNVFRPKFAAAGLPTKLRNVQLASFFRLYFCCLLDQDLKGQCR